MRKTIFKQTLCTVICISMLKISFSALVLSGLVNFFILFQICKMPRGFTITTVIQEQTWTSQKIENNSSTQTGNIFMCRILALFYQKTVVCMSVYHKHFACVYFICYFNMLVTEVVFVYTIFLLVTQSFLNPSVIYLTFLSFLIPY